MLVNLWVSISVNVESSTGCCDLWDTISHTDFEKVLGSFGASHCCTFAPLARNNWQWRWAWTLHSVCCLCTASAAVLAQDLSCRRKSSPLCGPCNIPPQACLGWQQRSCCWWCCACPLATTVSRMPCEYSHRACTECMMPSTSINAAAAARICNPDRVRRGSWRTCNAIELGSTERHLLALGHRLRLQNRFYIRGSNPHKVFHLWWTNPAWSDQGMCGLWMACVRASVVTVQRNAFKGHSCGFSKSCNLALRKPTLQKRKSNILYEWMNMKNSILQTNYNHYTLLDDWW